MHARSWSQPNPPILEEPDPFLPARLALTDAWRGAAGWVTIADEPTPVTLVDPRLPALARPDADGSDGDGRATPTDADAWLGARPLVAAIDAELARRSEIEPGQALTTLRAIGLAPWEWRP